MCGLECADSSRPTAFSPPTMKWCAGSLVGLVAALGTAFSSGLARADGLALKPSRELAPPATRTPATQVLRPGQPAAGARAPAAEPPRGVVFLRADRLEGN